MVEDLELTNNIVNGYWYSFNYEYPVSKKTIGYDTVPLVFVIGPSTKNMNVFVAINIHHIGSKADRYGFVEKMQQDCGFMNDDIRHIYTEESIQRICSTGVYKMSLRYYDKTKCRNIYRVKNGELGKYIMTDGDLTMSKPSQEEIKWNLEHRDKK